MSNIKLNLPANPFNGQIVTFDAPCDCVNVTDGLVINGNTYTICDAMGRCVTDFDGAWCSGSKLSVILDVSNKKAYIQNNVVTPASIGAAPAYTYGTDDLEAGTSPLESGKLHFVYE